MNKIFPLFLIMMVLQINCQKDEDNKPDGIVTDIEGNVYHTVTIGTQVWMVENLRTTKFNDGNEIPFANFDETWESLTTPGYCWCDNDETNNDTYGFLYNYYAVYTEKLSPTGWHIATFAEWQSLIEYLGGPDVAGSKLKEIGTAHWHNYNEDATNETGFTALPGGCRDDYGEYRYFTTQGWWWTFTPGVDIRFAYGMDHALSIVYASEFTRKHGLSVRCVKD